MIQIKHNKLRIPAGGRLTSWLFTRRGEVEFGATEDKSIQWQGGGFEPGNSRLQVQRPTTRARLPPYILSNHAFCRLYLLFFGNCFLQEGTTKLIYAFHPDDPFSEDNIPPHDFESRGARSALLLNTLDDIPKLPDDTKTFNFTANKVKLKKTASRFIDWCSEKYFEYRTSKLKSTEAFFFFFFFWQRNRKNIFFVRVFL